MQTRCEWSLGDPIYIEYHDREWGVPVHDDRKLFEFLVLDAMQAGLSWLTILKKRENFRKAFDDFHPEKVARYGGRKIQSLMSDAGIIRNKLKIDSAVANARAFLEVRKEFGSFDAYVWNFVGGVTKKNAWASLRDIPAQTTESVALSKDMVRRGFRFVGPTICYAFMQAAGLVNDHTLYCYRREEV
jgi:DNA-3-methyladenine glycosylase I